MNRYLYKNNLYKNGEWQPDHSEAMARVKARGITPTQKQAEYRDALYKFCVQKGLVKDGFKMGRTKQGISSSIRALITILEKNGLAGEFFAE